MKALAPLASDSADAAVGSLTNFAIDRFTKNMLFDEKMGGTIHMAVGAGIPITGSKNVSAVHWDMPKDMRDGGQIFVDDELVHENGAFLDQPSTSAASASPEPRPRPRAGARPSISPGGRSPYSWMG